MKCWRIALLLLLAVPLMGAGAKKHDQLSEVDVEAFIFDDEGETVPGLWTFTGNPAFKAQSNWFWGTPTTTIDMTIGDNDDEGIIKLGSSIIGMADHEISGTDFDGVLVFDGAASLDGFGWMFGHANSGAFFTLATGGAGFAHNSAYSLLIGPSNTTATIPDKILCATHFSNLDCDVASEQDLGVMDDIELLDDLFVGGQATVTEGIFASDGANFYSQFGGNPTTGTTSNTFDMLVARKLQTGTTSVRRAGLFVMDVDTGSDNSTNGQNYGMNATIIYAATMTGNNTRTAGSGGGVGGLYTLRHIGDGSISKGGGASSNLQIQGNDLGTVIDGYAWHSVGGDGGASSGGITDFRGFWAEDGTGNITNNYGIEVEDLSAGTNNYGIEIHGASTYALWLSNDSGTSNDGMTFGTTNTANLYRSAADTLKTDDSLIVATDLTVSGDAHGLVDEKCKYFESPATDDEFESIWRAPLALTINEIWCETDAGTIAADLEVDDGSPTGVNGSDLSCAAPNGTADASLAGDTTMAVGDRLDLDLGTVTTAVRLSICWKYTVD